MSKKVTMVNLQFRPALLVIDMQNDFLKPDSRLYNRGAPGLVPVINRLTAAARANKVPVIWVRQEHRRQLVDFGREGEISPVHCVEGTPGAALVADLDRANDDFTVIKRRFSGFYATDLDLLLRCLNRNLVLLAGINTDGCVQATAVDAHARDYYIRVVVEATAGWDEPAYQAALASLDRLQPGVVISETEALSQLVNPDKVTEVL
jgi:nicotinamidase-related amidase